MSWSEQRNDKIRTVHVFETAIDNSTWTPITLPTGVDCNTSLGKCRTNTNVWKLAHTSAGTPKYITFEAAGAVAVDIDKNAAAVLYYVKGTAASDTFEVLLGRRQS